MYAYGVYNIHISSSFIILILLQLCGCLVLCPYVQKYASSSVLWFSLSVPAESAHHIWNMQVCFEHAEVRQLAYFQLNIEMCLPSYFPLSNVWIINVPENREQSKQLWGLESLFNLLFQTQRQLNAVWTETGKKQLTLQRPEATPVEASHLKQKEWNWTCPPGRHGFFTANWSWS